MARKSSDASDSFTPDSVQTVFPFVADDGTHVAGNPVALMHVFKAGDWVYVFRVGFMQYPQLEGLAEIILPIPREAHFYFVRFKGEARPRRRYVLPGLYQTSPDAMLDSLLHAWRIKVPPELRAEFFPDDLTHDNDNEEV